MWESEAGLRFESAAVECMVSMTRANALLARGLGRSLLPWSMSWPQALSLMILSQQEAPISATHLVESLGLGRTAMTSVVDRLVRHGWVERQPDASDRRTARLVLTPAGRGVVADVRPALEAASAQLLSGLEASDFVSWQVGLVRLVETLSAQHAG